ncbi:hypothetical protein E2605_18010 [Dysgonomonas capnocytophagoides]|uniref:Uncharacterized protein n=1 Tax=Dysgonomonas capnocytophagoides TaxID=45254 RepID=A0A4Y8KUI2_9BACT|nr:hypothetical protein [Dysgonomonas capnocytophagoides]TFD93009.1 hypothetical protein E2605_18010 [Dysgonomonas capnocytophagoides]
MQIELYINNQLCDIGNPSDFSVYLKRVFINPSELAAKDAQKSYNITLPATARNNIVFGFSNIEEVKGKFVKIYDAYLIVGGVKIFNGKFRLSEITSNSYSGNLGIPAKKTIKDIFVDRTMTEVSGTWLKTFKDDFFEAIKEYNEKDDFVFFPMVLYSLFSKTKNGDEYTDKTTFDNTVTLSMFDFPPSINCIEAIKTIFHNEGLTLSGTALTDSKLTKLFMSYRNPVDYDMKWNYRGLLDLNIYGSWFCYDSRNSAQSGYNSDKRKVSFDLLGSGRHNTIHIDSNKGNMLTERVSNGNVIREIIIPTTAIYEIYLNVSFSLDDGAGWDEDRPYLGDDLRLYHSDKFEETFKKFGFEIKLIKENSLSSVDLDRKFDKPNIAQNIDRWEYIQDFPKYLPEEGKTMIIDQAQNNKFICGVGFGNEYLPDAAKNYYTSKTNPMIGRNGWSIDSSYSQTDSSYITSKIDGYTEYNRDSNGVHSAPSDYNKREILNFDSNSSLIVEENRATGFIKVYAYLQKGDRLNLVSTSSVEELYIGNNTTLLNCIMAHNVEFQLSVKPIMYDKEFVNGDIDANNINSDILKDDIDLIKFLPSDIKINDWLDNFCKAFNLSLIQSDNGGFEINTPQKEQFAIGSIIDLDNRCSIIGRKNTPLGLPSVYDIGFTINQDEEGYISTGDNGGGQYETGSIDGDTLTQTSTFSYNWFKSILFEDHDVSYNIPVITNSEIWKPLVRDYEDMMSKTYFDLAQRFFYRDGNINITYNRQTITLGKVSNSTGGMILNYKNNPASILNNYFTVFVNSDANFTTVECFLTPDEYYKLPCLVRLNGDLYNVADVDGYDPLGKKKATLKLIRKIK